MKLIKGINLGGYLSQCDHTQKHYENFLKEEDIHKIAELGFDHVRVPVDVQVWENEDGSPNEYGYSLTDRLVDWCKAAGLDIILDLHKAHGYDVHGTSSDRALLFASLRLQERFINLWHIVASRYASEDMVAFELLNDVIEDHDTECWNELITKTVSAIREVAPKNTIIYGGIQWNNVSQLKYLNPPVDDNIIFTFHFYTPMEFTHQNAEWVKHMDVSHEFHYPCREKGWDINSFVPMLEEGVFVGRKYDVRLYCGEYGVIDQAPAEDTLRWYSDISKLFNLFNIGSAIWSYKNMDFGLMDTHYDSIRDRLVAML